MLIFFADNLMWALILTTIKRNAVIILALFAVLAVSPYRASPAEDCGRIDRAVRKALREGPRTVITSLPSTGNTCKFHNRDPGIRSSPLGILEVTTFGTEGAPVAEYRRPAGRCQPMNGVGQMAELCILSDDYSHFRQSLAVYRSGKKVLQLEFFDWPSAPNPAFGEAHDLAIEILGPFANAPTKEPVLTVSSGTDSSVAQIQKSLLPKAKSGNAEAQFAMGVSYEYCIRDAAGKPTPNFDAAAYWYKQSADNHFPAAEFAIGLLYRDGRGVSRDEYIAIHYLTAASDSGNVPAMTTLGMLYAKKGRGWSRYYMPLLKKAEASGSAEAVLDLGIIRYESGLHEPSGMEGFRKGDFSEAMKKFKQADAMGDCAAALNIGGMYFNGDGVPQSSKDAKAWFLKTKTCGGASENLKKKAGYYLAKVDAGHLPSALPDPPTKPQLTAGQVAAGIGVIGFVAAMLNQASQTPEDKKTFDQEMRDIQNKSADDWDRYQCEMNLVGSNDWYNHALLCP
jgi:TPR repeat protein